MCNYQYTLNSNNRYFVAIAFNGREGSKMGTRIIVTGFYNARGEYELINEEGEQYMVLKEGESFFIGNQMSPWNVRRKPNGKLFCEKHGEIVELPAKKKGLWALTSGAARNGLFHWYKEPVTALDKKLVEMRVSSRIVEKVNQIDMKASIGGTLCSHSTGEDFYISMYTDGNIREISEPRFIENHYNQYHIGCMASTYEVEVKGGSYCILYKEEKYMNGSHGKRVEKIVYTHDCEEELIISKLNQIL